MAYIIDTYNRYDKWDREHSLYVFTINEQKYAIKEVMLDWGEPQLPMRLGAYQNPSLYFIFNSYKEAEQYVKYMKSLNR